MLYYRYPTLHGVAKMVKLFICMKSAEGLLQGRSRRVSLYVYR